MNPFLLMSTVFVGILIYRIICRIQKNYWLTAPVLITKTSWETDASGCITLSIGFEYDDRMLHNEELVYIEEFTNLSVSHTSVKEWLKARNIEPGERVDIHYNPNNPLNHSFYKHASPKDRGQIIIWSCASLISLLVAIFVTGPK